MINIAVDVGFGWTKSSEGIIFPSKIKEGDSIIGDGYHLFLDGKQYSVGVGEGTLELNKINHSITKSCLVTAIALSTNDEDVNLVTGLPIGQFSMMYRQLERTILDYKSIKYNLNGKDRVLRINNVAVFPQGAGALYAYDIVGDVILIDIGYRTVDTAYFKCINGKRQLAEHDTKYNGMLSLYDKVITRINSRFNKSYDVEYGEKILTEGLSQFGEPVDLSWLQPVYDSHVGEIVNNLMLKYPHYDSVPIYLCGGGAYVLYKAFAKHIKNILVLKDSQFSNVLGFQRLGNSMWGGK